ncbi:MAG: hypothetical protein ABI405_10565 [Parafilimonas sp.]
MKNLLLLLFILKISSSQSLAQQITDTCCILKKEELIGIWQRNDSLIGSGLNQNFQFFKDDSFVLNVGSDDEDLRDIIQLKGKYRISKNELFFTVNSKTIIDGPIEIADAGISLNIFTIKKEKLVEVKEPKAQEISDPCFITLISNKHIKINNEIYYKVK